MDYICRFYPPYTNSHKDVPCDTLLGAISLRDWFQNTGVKANVFSCMELLTLIEG